MAGILTGAAAMRAEPAPPVTRDFLMTDEDFQWLAALIGQQTGIVVTDRKREMLYSRLARRVRALGLPDFAAYCDHVRQDEDGEELGRLVNAVTTNLTAFFRENHHFRHLAETTLPGLRGARRLRLWSAGCSTGEEPYSIAMTLADHLAQHGAGVDARILATDIDTDVLARAAAGYYGEERLASVPDALRRRHVQDTPQGPRMQDSLRRLIAFKPLNLLGPWPMRGPFQVIFCRNVLIYFDRPTQIQLLRRFGELLEPGGYLYLGHSENLHQAEGSFTRAGQTTWRKQC